METYNLVSKIMKLGIVVNIHEFEENWIHYKFTKILQPNFKLVKNINFWPKFMISCPIYPSHIYTIIRYYLSKRSAIFRLFEEGIPTKFLLRIYIKNMEYSLHPIYNRFHNTFFFNLFHKRPHISFFLEKVSRILI